MTINLGDKNAEMLGLETSDAAQSLLEERQTVMENSRAILDRFNDKLSDAEIRKLEREHDHLMARYDEIDAKLAREENFSVRSALAGREGRSAGGASFSRSNAHMRPSMGDIECMGQDDGFAEFRLSEEPGATFALRSNQSFFSHVMERSGNNSDRVLGGLSTGGYLRAMVTGPKNDLEKRALAEGSDSAGGFTVPEILSARLIDRMRAASVVFRAGAQIVPLYSDVSYIAKIANDPVPAWRMENGAIKESDPTFSRVTFTAKSLAVMVRVSRELLEDSLNLEAALPDLLAVSLAQELDRVALLGSGVAPEPRGVSNFAGLTPNNLTPGAVVGYSPLIKLRTAIKMANSEMSAFIMSPRDEGEIASWMDHTGQPLNVPSVISRTPILTTTKIPIDLGSEDNESVIFAGDWRRLMVGIRSAIRIEISREIFADHHQYCFVAHMRADVAAEHEAAFTKVQGILTPWGQPTVP